MIAQLPPAGVVCTRSSLQRRLSLILLLPLLAVVLAAGWTAPAHADDEPGPGAGVRNTMTVGITTATKKGLDDRGNYEYELLPGGLVVDYVSVSNYSLKPVTVRLLARTATSQDTNAFVVQPTNAAPGGLSSWISIGEPVVKLAPRTTRTVPFQVGVPRTAEPGDYAGAMVMSLMAERKLKKGEKAAPVAVEHRVALKMMLRVPGQIQPGLEVASLDADWDGAWSPTGHGDVRLSYTVRNTGNVRLSADPTLTLDRSFGLAAITVKGERVKDLLPGGELVVDQVVPDVFTVGPMTAKVSVQPSGVDRDLPEKQDPTTASVDVASWCWLLLVVLAALLLLVAAYVVWRRRRKHRRPVGGGPGGRRARRDGSPAAPAAPASAPEVAGISSRRALRAIGAGTFAVVALMLGVAPAQAEDPETWRATTSTKKGTVDVAFELKTSGGCPAPATNMLAWVTGKGFPKAGAVAISNTPAPAMDTPFTGYLVDSLSNMMAMQPSPAVYAGTYEFRLTCITAEDYDHSYGDYVVRIGFTDPQHWHVLAPVTTKAGPHGGIAGGDADPSDAGSTGAGTPGGPLAGAGDPATSADQVAEAQAASDAAAAAADTAAVDRGSSGGMNRTSWSLVGLGVLMLGGVFAWLFISRPQA